MPTPPKPVKVIEMEGKSHRTKKELAQRRRAEEELLTGIRLKEKPEVKENEEAHREFLHLKKLLAQIGKDDDLYGNAINRYCIMTAECNDMRKMQENSRIALEEFRKHAAEMINNGEMNASEVYRIQDSLEKNYQKYSQILTTKLKALADAEKENSMTILSALRSIPKTTEKKSNPLMEALRG